MKYLHVSWTLFCAERKHRNLINLHIGIELDLKHLTPLPLRNRAPGIFKQAEERASMKSKLWETPGC